MSPREQLQPFIDLAFVEFGMREDEFLAQTPIQWDRRFEALLDREKRIDRRIARLCLVIAKSQGAEGVSENTFMPGYQEEIEEQTTDEIFSTLEAINTRKHGNQHR